MPFVLDASVTAAWHFPDEQGPRSDSVLHRLGRDSCLVPLQWWFEIRNVVLFGERRGRASTDASIAFIERLSTFSIRLAPLPDSPAIFDLARRHRLTFYDAAYLELAMRERLPLATLDNALAAAARREGVALI